MNGSEFVQFMKELESMTAYYYIKHGNVEIPLNVEGLCSRLYWFIEIDVYHIRVGSKRDTEGIGFEALYDCVEFAKVIEHDDDLSEKFMNGIKEALEINA